MVKFRRRPTNRAKIGVSLFVLYSLRTAHTHALAKSSAAAALGPAAVLTLMISAFFLFVEPIPQPQAYHDFADKRRFLCSCHASTEGFFLPPGAQRRRGGFVVPNFGDVASNVVIFAGGIYGLVALHWYDYNRRDDAEEEGVEAEDPIREWQLKVCLPTFFSSTVVISAGSTYYHWAPSNGSLVWDRLPMTLAFVSVFCFMLEEYMPTVGMGQSLLQPLLGVGVFSVGYWHRYDDLRLYALVQFLPLMAIAALLVCSRPRHGGAMQQTMGLMCYAVAKACEDRDYEIFSWTNKTISGHSLKHVFAGLASVSIASMLHFSDKGR